MLYVRNQFEISSKSNMPACTYKHNHRVYSHCTAWPNFSILYSLVGYKQANQPGFSFTGLPTRIVKCVLLWEATAAQHHVDILTKTKRNSVVLRSCWSLKKTSRGLDAPIWRTSSQIESTHHRRSGQISTQLVSFFLWKIFRKSRYSHILSKCVSIITTIAVDQYWDIMLPRSEQSYSKMLRRVIPYHFWEG